MLPETEVVAVDSSVIESVARDRVRVSQGESDALLGDAVSVYTTVTESLSVGLQISEGDTDTEDEGLFDRVTENVVEKERVLVSSSVAVELSVNVTEPEGFSAEREGVGTVIVSVNACVTVTRADFVCVLPESVSVITTVAVAVWSPVIVGLERDAVIVDVKVYVCVSVGATIFVFDNVSVSVKASDLLGDIESVSVDVPLVLDTSTVGVIRKERVRVMGRDFAE